MKNLVIMSLLTSSLISSSLNAEDFTLPNISTPESLEEGTQRELSKAQIDELLPWPRDSKIFINDLIDHAQSLPMEQKLERLTEGLKQVVSESSLKHSELLMRYSLNRALVVLKVLDNELEAGAVGSIDAKTRVVMESLKLALKYYDFDINTLSNKAPTPFAQFGSEYFQFLTELNKSIFDASAQYNVQRLAFEFLQWDLYRDLKNTSYAPQIVKINNALKIFPLKKMPDSHALNYIRQMRKTIEQLNLKSKIEKTNDGQAQLLFSTEKVETFEAPRGNYRYYNYDKTPGSNQGGCYQISSNGATMWEQGRVRSSLCASQSFRYYNYDNTPGSYKAGCYQVAANGAIMWEQGAVSNSQCGSSTYRYYNYDRTPGGTPGGCYQIASNGAVMWAQGTVSGKCN